MIKLTTYFEKTEQETMTQSIFKASERALAVQAQRSILLYGVTINKENGDTIIVPPHRILYFKITQEDE